MPIAYDPDQGDARGRILDNLFFIIGVDRFGFLGMLVYYEYGHSY